MVPISVHPLLENGVLSLVMALTLEVYTIWCIELVRFHIEIIRRIHQFICFWPVSVKLASWYMSCWLRLIDVYSKIQAIHFNRLILFEYSMIYIELSWVLFFFYTYVTWLRFNINPWQPLEFTLIGQCLRHKSSWLVCKARFLFKRSLWGMYRRFPQRSIDILTWTLTLSWFRLQVASHIKALTPSISSCRQRQYFSSISHSSFFKLN